MSNKIIIFGLGSVFERVFSFFDSQEILFLADNNKEGEFYKGFRLIKCEDISKQIYDYVVICNKNNLLEIMEQLVSCGVDESKIVNWSYYLYTTNSRFNLFEKFDDLVNGLITALNINRVLCLDNDSINNDLILKTNAINMDNQSTEECGIIISKAPYLKYSLSAWMDIIEKYRDKVNYIAFGIPYVCSNEWSEWSTYDFSRIGEVALDNISNSVFVLIDLCALKCSEKTAIYVATHKKFVPPNNKIYIPIYAGMSNNNDMGIQGDNVNDNISIYNDLINEATVLYWIWKNTDKEIVGLNHYRRYLVKHCLGKEYSKRLLNETDIRVILRDYDMIVKSVNNTYPVRVIDHLRDSVGQEVFDNVFFRFRDIVKSKHYDYLKEFDAVFDGYNIIFCNMFITRKTIFDEYCKWLFDIVLEACKTIDMRAYTGNDHRMIGYMAERMLSVWIIHNKLRIKGLPIVLLEN